MNYDTEGNKGCSEIGGSTCSYVYSTEREWMVNRCYMLPTHVPMGAQVRWCSVLRIIDMSYQYLSLMWHAWISRLSTEILTRDADPTLEQKIINRTRSRLNR